MPAWALFLAAGFAAVDLYAVWCSTTGGNSLYFSPMTLDYRWFHYVSQGHVIQFQMPVLYAYSLVLCLLYAIAVAVGLLRSQRWAQSLSRFAPVFTIPLWLPVFWYLAEYISFSRTHYIVSTDEGNNPLILVSNLRTAALSLLPFWLAISLLYLRSLRRCREAGPREVQYRTGGVLRGTALVVAAAALSAAGLLIFRLPDGRMLIHDTACYGWTSATNLLCALGQDVNARAEYGRMPLHFAAEAGRLYTAVALLDHGANIDARGFEGWTPAMTAAEQEWTHPLPNADCRATLEMLIKRGTDVRAGDCEGLTIANHLIGQPKYPSRLVEMIVERGCPVNVGVTGAYVNYALLGYAVERGGMRDVGYLLSHGARMYPRLVARASFAKLRFLVQHGFGADSRDEHGATPLHYIFEREEDGMADGKACFLLLLRHGADVNARDKTGRTILDLAEGNSVDQEMWSAFLQKHGARHGQPR